jgi:hypothetical protein
MSGQFLLGLGDERFRFSLSASRGLGHQRSGQRQRKQGRPARNRVPHAASLVARRRQGQVRERRAVGPFAQRSEHLASPDMNNQ